MTLITEPTRQLTSETKLMTSAYVKMSLTQKNTATTGLARREM